jgi:ubiquitin-protein ligase/Mg-chelatase subunit ChlD
MSHPVAVGASSNVNVRVQRDLVEVLTNPLEGCDIYLPNEGTNVNHWVFRLRANDGLLEGQHFYFEMRFSAQYPSIPPSLRALTFIPHACVDAARYEICLTMLSTISCSRRYCGWRPALSALAILRQLNVLFDYSVLVYNDSVDEELARIRDRVRVFEANERVAMKLERLKYYTIQYEVPLAVEENESAETSQVAAACAPAASEPAAGAETCSESNVDGNDDWTVVAKKQHAPAPAPPVPAKSKSYKNILASKPPVSAPVKVSISSKKSVATEASAGAGKGIAAETVVSAGISLSHNMYALLRETDQLKSSKASSSVKTNQPHHVQAVVSSKPWEPSWKRVVSAAIPSNAVIQPTANCKMGNGMELNSVASRAMLQAAGPFKSMSNYLLQHILLYCGPEEIAWCMASCKFMLLSCIDGHIWRTLLGRYYPSSSMIPQASQDHRTGLCWRQIWLMEANQARYCELKCFYSKRTIAEDVMGIPLNYTINPRTGCVDYIYSSMELMSKGCYTAGIRVNTWGEAINGFMPLYLTKEHFTRALPRIQESILKLSLQDSRQSNYSNNSSRFSRHGGAVGNSMPASATRSFTPKLVLEVLPRMMNTMIVLLADNGIEELDTCVHGYCQLHRLFIALLRQFPQLRPLIAARLRRFIDQPDRRSKHHEPNLGELIVLVSVCEEVGWVDIISAITQESFARSVLWACRDCPDLAKLATNSRIYGSTSSSASMPKDQQLRLFPDSLLDEIIKCSQTRHSLFAFHCAFLRVVGCSPHGALLTPLERLHDRTMGLPPRHLKQRLLALVSDVVQNNEQMHSWDAFFDSICMARVSKENLKLMWLSSIRKSAAQGYHSHTTDFSRIQSRGVSNILLRGKSYPRVVFCIDTSGSMCMEFADPSTGRVVSRLDYVKEELLAIFSSKLTHRNQFTLVPFNSHATVWARGLQQATHDNLKAAASEVEGWHPNGGTSFRDALNAAFKVHQVEEIYFLSDGEDYMNMGELDQMLQRLSRNGAIRCHTTAFFAPPNGQQVLQAIAKATGGSYVAFGDYR